MDGRDKAGKMVRDKIIGTTNELNTFDYLLNMMARLDITDDVLSDKTLRQITDDFINQLPLIDISNTQFFKTIKTNNEQKLLLHDPILYGNTDIFNQINKKREKELGYTEDQKELEKFMNKNSKDIPSILNLKEEIDKAKVISKNINENSEKILNKDDDEKTKQNKKMFINDKCVTYSNIYSDFFEKKIIKNWNEIPPLFNSKFPVFLFMDGKDKNGSNVRDKLLDKENEFEVFTMLHNFLVSTVDNSINFDTPSDEISKKILNDFTEFMPDIKVITQKQVMECLNDPYDKLFEADIDDCDEEQEDNKDPDDKGGFQFIRA
jgi:hypothetical protein